MSFTSNYKYEAPKRLEPGDYRVEIVEAKFDHTASGKNAIIITIRPNNSGVRLKKYLVEGEYFDRMTSEVFESFQIKPGDFNLAGWVGAVGGARLILDKRDDRYLAISYFLSPKKQETLPPWVGDIPERMTVSELGGGYEDEPDGEGAGQPPADDELPF